MISQGAIMRRNSRHVVILGSLVAALALIVFLPTCGLAEAPRVLGRSPETGEELGVDAPIELIFDRAMDRASVETALSISPSTPGGFEWVDARTVRFHPSDTWKRDAEFRATLSSSARSGEGDALIEPYTFRFRTVGYLSVAEAVPVDGSTDIAVNSAVFVVFTRPVVPLTALSDPGYAALPAPLRIEPAACGAGEWLNTSIYVFTPAEPLRGGTRYTVTVPAGLTDTTGGIVAEDVTWGFTTERPAVVWTEPDPGEDLVAVDTAIRVTFNMPVSLDGARERFRVRPTSPLGGLFARDVPGTLVIDEGDLVFTPCEPLAFSQSYEVSVDAGVTGAYGGLGTETSVEWRFDTVPLPRILGTSPRDGERDVPPYGAFLIRFNAPVDPKTVEENLVVEPAPEPGELYGYFRGWDNAYVLQFGSGPSREYTIRIGPDIADRYGNRTGQSIVVHFRTRSLDPAAWLHVPGSVGTCSTYEPAKVFIAHRNLSSVTLTLTRISLEEYFRALDDMHRYSPPQDGRIRHWSIDVSSPLDEVGYTPIDLVLGGVLEAGIYVVDLRAQGVPWNTWQHRHVLIASAANLTIKSAESETVVWATDLDTGQPLPGLILRAYDGDGDPIDASITDRDGLATFVGGADLDWRGLTLASNVPFALGSSAWSDGISTWEFGYSAAWVREWRVFLDTDRPIYRPGESVHFRGILREEEDAAYSLPAGLEVEVTVRDAGWSLVYEETLSIDEFGTFAGTLELEQGAALGDYQIRVTYGNETSGGSFVVAEYRAPEFEVSVSPDREEVGQGEPVDVSIGLEYFFGGPVADLPVSWRAFSSDYRFSPAQHGRYSFTAEDDPWTWWCCWWMPPESPVAVLEGQGRSDTDGRLRVELPGDVGALHLEDAGTWPGSRVLTVEATAVGKDGQTLSGRDTLVVHAGDFYIGVAVDRSIGRAGDPIEVDLVTVDWTGGRLADRSLAYTILRREWENVFEEDEAGGGTWVWTTVDTEVEVGTVATDAVGEARLLFLPPEGGTYKILVEGVDALERVVRSSRFVWVSGPETVSWRRTNDDRIALISDRAQYEVGDAAEILIPSPYAGNQWALVTVERAGILSRDVVQLESNSSVYRLEILEEHIPNIYVGVVLVEGREAAAAALDGAPPVASTKVGYVELAVSRAPRVLRIEMEPSVSLPAPGETIAYDVRVTDAEGAPVQASLALDLVDKAILTLLPRTANAVAEAFYGRRGLGVETASGLTISLNRLVAEQLQQVDDTSLAKYETGAEAVAGAGPPPSPAAVASQEGDVSRDTGASQQLPAGVELREEFEDTAYWSADIRTGVDGRTQVAISLPDNLTTWVVRGVGVTVGTAVGEATTDLLVTKPLLIRPVTPRFFVVGDRVRLAANVSNRTPEDRFVEVTVGQAGLALESEAVQRVAVVAGGEETVTWWATVLDVPSVDLAFSAVSGDLSDAARPRLTTGPDGTLLVYRYTVPETVGTAGQLAAAGSRTEVIALPRNAERDRSELVVRLETSLAASMQEGLRFLEHFEYECTEQVVSRFLPNLLTYRAVERLGIESPTLAEKLPRLVAEGLDKLYVRQNGDGGWGWWADERSNVHLTAYVVFALTHARDAGYPVNQRVLERGLDYVERGLVARRDIVSLLVANRQAWLLFVMTEAGRGGAASEHVDALFSERAKLSHYGRALLAMVVHRLEPSSEQIGTLVSDLYNEAILSATGAHWEEVDRDWWAMNTDTRSTAIILDALVRIDPAGSLLPNVVRWLMVSRKDGIWETTQETAWALIALTDWMEATGDLAGDYTYAASLNGEELHAGTASMETHLEPTRIQIPAASLAVDVANPLTISRGEGPGTLYYTAHLRVRLPVEEVEPLHRGIIVQRQYVRADCPLGGVCESLDTVAVGETVQVRLTIIALQDLYYVVLEDPFPAGCEAVDPALATSSLTDLAPSLFRESEGDRPWFYSWWWRWYTRSELRDEKLALFADYLPAGTYTYRYTLRATVPGEYRARPAAAYEFYFPEVFGRSDGRILVVEPEG